MNTISNQNAERLFVGSISVPERKKTRFVAPKALVIGFIWVFLCISGQVYGQFIVQPMLIEYEPRPNSRLNATIELQNWERTQGHVVKIDIVDLNQTDNGFWMILDANDRQDPNLAVDMAKLHSCRDWITLGTQGRVTINPGAIKPVKVGIVVPAKARGFYCAAVRAALEPREDIDQVAIRYELVVPILLEISGSGLRQQVKLVDAGLKTLAEDHTGQAESTMVSLGVENTGGTYSRLTGFAQVHKILDGDKTRIVVPRVRFKEMNIIPGSSFNLQADLQKPLPTGRYRVVGALYVDGRREKGIEKDINYVGPTGVDSVAADVILTVDPPVALLETSPGRARFQMMTIHNDSADPVDIKASIDVPPGLGGKVLVDVLGDKMICADWVEVIPSDFTLRGYGRRNVRVTARMPNVEKRYKAFYGNLNLVATYTESGAPAGSLSSQVCVINTNEDSQTISRVVGATLKSYELSPSMYSISSTFKNQGNIHMKPRVDVYILRADNSAVKHVEMESDGVPALMLPMESRVFSGAVNISDVVAGDYTLEAVLSGQVDGERQEFRVRKTITVYDEGTQVKMQILGSAPDAGTEGQGASW